MLVGKRILITGGAGFIGSNLAEYFLQNNHVTVLDNFSTGHKHNLDNFLNNSNFNLIEGDIRKIEDCREASNGMDIILHQAALGSVPRSINDPITTNQVNVDGFLNMLVAANESEVKRFVYAASSSTYGDSKALPKIEENIGSPLSPYAVTKYVNELYATVFSNLYDIEIIGLRYFNVFGRRQDPNGAYAAAIPKFIRSFLDLKSPIVHGDGSQTRDFTYIQNVIQANELAAETTNPEAFNNVYNVAYGERTILLDLIKKIQALLSEINPAIGDVNIEFGPERIGDVKHSLASIDKAKRILGYKPSHSVVQGLDEAIEWYCKELTSK